MPVRKNSFNYTGNYYSLLIYRLLLAFVAFWLSRLFFYLLNTAYFSHLNFADVIGILFYGIRFDISSLILINTPFIVLMILPLPLRNLKWYRWFAGFVFYLGNFIGLALNLIDVIYFRFTQKRMTADFFVYLKNEGGFIELFPQFLHDFWYMFLIMGALFGSLVYFSRKLIFIKRERRQGLFKYYMFQFAGLIISAFVIVISIRGGLQPKPIIIITAAQYTKVQDIPFLLNTPFTIFKTINQQALQKVNYFEEDKLDSIYSPVHHVDDKTPIPVPGIKNVVIIIMESMSGEHIGYFNKHIPDYAGFTPFLDSLIELEESVAFNGFANGKISIEAVTAIAVGLPNLMNRPYILSAYSGNKINTLPNILQPHGYNSFFYHGGTNGTMDFDGFAIMAGYDEYIGRTEYDNDEDFDGNWGIFDEPFFQYVAQNLNATDEPFFATLFSVSAHHPYTIPDKHKGKFRKGKLEIQEAVMYADYSLRKFFETASTMDWFNQTLFVITADHTSTPGLDEYRTRLGIYRIPFVFYSPQWNVAQPDNIVVSQTDILPTVLSLLDFNDPVIAFGNNIFDEKRKHFSVNYLEGIYQIIDEDYILQFDGKNSFALYDYNKDKLLNDNLINKNPAQTSKMEETLKAYIQQYNTRLINNRLTIE